MSNSDRVKVSYVKETSFGVLPGSPVFQEVGVVSESLKNNTTATASAQIRNDRQVAGKRRTGRTAGGDITVELQPNAFDDWLESLLQSDATWTAPTFTPIVLTDAVVTVSSGGTIGTIATATGDLSTVKQGMFLKLTSGPTGFADHIVIATDDGVTASVKVSGLRSGFPADDLTIDEPEQIINGVTQDSYGILKEFTDLPDGAVTDAEFHLVLGQTFGAFSLGVSPENIITATFTLNGQQLTRSVTAPAGSSVTPLVERDAFDAVESLKAMVIETDSDNPTPPELIEVEVTEITMELANNLRDRLVVGKLSPTSIGAGQIGVEGSVAMFFDNEGGKDARPIMDANIGFTPGRMMFVMTEPSTGKGYGFDLRRIRFEDVETFAGGINTDVIQTATISAERSSVVADDYTIRIARFSA